MDIKIKMKCEYCGRTQAECWIDMVRCCMYCFCRVKKEHKIMDREEIGINNPTETRGEN